MEEEGTKICNNKWWIDFLFAFHQASEEKGLNHHSSILVLLEQTRFATLLTKQGLQPCGKYVHVRHLENYVVEVVSKTSSLK